jgi:hypothetical protein
MASTTSGGGRLPSGFSSGFPGINHANANVMVYIAKSNGGIKASLRKNKDNMGIKILVAGTLH